MLLSEEGVQQGDPLGPLLFCLATLPIVKRLSSPLNMWYLDDGTLGGFVSYTIYDLTNCCSITYIENAQQVEVSDLTLLGAPLGNQAIKSVLEKKISELSVMGSRLSWIFSHHALFLLKNCFALPKFLYVLRTSPCFDHPLLQSFDDLQFELLRKLLNIKLVDHARQQASLPVPLGGMVVISTTAITSSAFISSKLSCADLEASLLSTSLPLPPPPPPESLFTSAGLVHAITDWKARSNANDPPSSTRQRVWSLAVIRNVQQSRLSSAVDAQDEARLLAVSQREAGTCLEALYTSPLSGFPPWR